MLGYFLNVLLMANPDVYHDEDEFSQVDGARTDVVDAPPDLSSSPDSPRKDVRGIIEAVKKDSTNVAEGILSSRQTRILEEDERLKESPNQRKILILDYIRRGKLLDGVEILSELVHLTPQILDSNMIDVEEDDYDFEETIKNLISIFSSFEDKLAHNDNKIRDFLKNHRLIPRDNDLYLDSVWYKENILKQLSLLKKPKNPKNPQSDEEYKKNLNKRVLTGLSKVLDSEDNSANLNDLLLQMMEQFMTENSTFHLELKSFTDHPIESFADSKRPKKGFAYFQNCRNMKES